MMQSTRRGVLATLGVSLVSSGCLSVGSPDRSDGTDGTPPTSPQLSDDDRRVAMGTTVTIDGTSITVTNPRVRKAVVSPGMAHTRVVATAAQFVVVDMLVNGTPPDRFSNGELFPVVDGETLQDSPVPTTDEGGYAFTIPTAGHETAAIQWTSGDSEVYWSLPQSILEPLATEPQFVVRDLHLRRQSGDPVLAVTVANEGDRDGHFAARVSFDGYSGGGIIAFTVPAGESRSYVGSPEDVLHYFENQGGDTLTVQYPTNDGLTNITRTVSPAETSTS